MITVTIEYTDNDNFSFMRRVKLPVESIEETFIKKFQNAIQSGIKLIRISYDATFEIAPNTSLEEANKLAIALKDNGINSLEDLYHWVFDNASKAWIANAEGSGLYNVMPFDEETVNQMFADKKPWEIIHSVDPDFNDTDDYLYINGVNQLASMNDDEFCNMLINSANMLLDKFCVQNDEHVLISNEIAD